MIYYPPKPTLITIDQPLFTDLDNDPNVGAELKYNGNHLVLKKFAPGIYEFWNRYGKKFQYIPTKEVLAELNALNWVGDCVCDGELRHNKVVGMRHHIVLWDIFVWNGESLKNSVFNDRRAVLEMLFLGAKNKQVKISQIWKEGFKQLFNDAIKDDEIEGLVMKKLNAKLILGNSTSPTVKYMFKVRKPNNSYRF